MQFLKSLFSIGVFLLGLVVLSPQASALWSPTLSQKAALIQQHLTASRMQNGSGTLLSVATTVADRVREKREQKKSDGPVSRSQRLRNRMALEAFKQTLLAPLDGLFAAFNVLPSTRAVISNCLRDDLWTLELLRGQVVTEAMKAYWMLDFTNGEILSQDFYTLTGDLYLLRNFAADNPARQIYALKIAQNAELIEQSGAPERLTVNAYFFGSDTAHNNYIHHFPATPNAGGCPAGDIEQAALQVARSAKVLQTLGSGKGAAFGSIWETAQANAVARADQWIEANQVALTIGGPEGVGARQSLVKNGGWERAIGAIETELKTLSNLVGPVVPFLGRTQVIPKMIADNCAYYEPAQGGFFTCTELQKNYLDICSRSDKKSRELQQGIYCSRLIPAEKMRRDFFSQLSDLRAREAQRHIDLAAMEQAFRHRISYQEGADEAIKAMDAEAARAVMVVRQTVGDFGKKAGEGLLDLRKPVEELNAKHCANKSD